jgi:hypothetical protein
MTPKSLTREQLDAWRAGHRYPAEYQVLATLDAAHEDEARALNSLFEMFHYPEGSTLKAAFEARRILRDAGVLR